MDVLRTLNAGHRTAATGEELQVQSVNGIFQLRRQMENQKFQMAMNSHKGDISC
jgi:hypothetical protein